MSRQPHTPTGETRSAGPPRLPPTRAHLARGLVRPLLADLDRLRERISTLEAILMHAPTEVLEHLAATQAAGVEHVDVA